MKRGFAVVVILAAFAAGCDAPLDPDGASSPASRSSLGETGPKTMDDLWAELADGAIRGFAGHSVEEDGSSTVYLTPNGAPDAARAHVGRYRAARGLGAGVIRVVPVRYDFRQLKDWSAMLTPLLSSPHVVLIDIDERTNRILVGVAQSSMIAEVHRTAAARGVPSGAMQVRVVERPEARAALNTSVGSAFSQPPGGVATINSVRGRCTIGFNAIYTGGWFDPQWVPGFVTASHCSATSFTLDHSAQYQPAIRNSAYLIGTEHHDPPKYSCGWMGFCFARGSDATFFRYNPGIAYQVGYIAKTTYAAVGTFGSGWIDTGDPRFEITSTAWQEETVVGTWLNKVGSSTGWTRGQVTQTCVALDGLVCQFVSTIYSEPGDSGSPIFEDGSNTATPSGSQVKLHGLLWGGPPGNWNVTWFSHIYNIGWDMGGLCVTSSC